jgi:hypothetical protein
MRLKIVFVFLSMIVMLTVGIWSTAGQDQINYISRPDELTIFLNDVVFVRDVLRVPLGSETQIVLPAQIVPDTISLYDDSGHIPLYTITAQSGQYVLIVRDEQAEGGSEDIRNLTLEYIAYGGIRWKPLYNLRLDTENVENVEFDFFAAIQNDSFTLEDTQINLAAGVVNVEGQQAPPAFYDQNQGFNDMRATATAPSTAFNTPTPTGTPLPSPTPASQITPPPPPVNVTPEAEAFAPLTTQYIYRLEPLTAEPGETLYAELLETEFPARQVLLWNAYSDGQASVIYKVRNTSDIALTAGIVRTYQDGLFTGSDEIEYTSPGGEGSVTMGPLQDMRVQRETTQIIVPAENPGDENGQDMQVEVSLKLTNFSPFALEIEVTDVFPAQAFAFAFSDAEAERQGGNVLRWLVTVPAGEEVTIRYQYRMPN